MFLRSTEKREKKIKKKDLNEDFKCRYLSALGVIPSVNFFTALKSTDDLLASLFMLEFLSSIAVKKDY